MKRISRFLFLTVITIVFIATSRSFARDGVPAKSTATFQIQNDKVSLTVAVDNNSKLLYEDVEAQSGWVQKYGSTAFDVKNDADFLLNIMWTGWSAPGKIENADNVVHLTKKDFVLSGHNEQTLESGGKELDLTFKGSDNPLLIEIRYKIMPGQFYIRKMLSVRDPRIHGKVAGNFLRWIWPVHGFLKTDSKLIKKGGFGQPVAIKLVPKQASGAFFGMEYPTSENEAKVTPAGTRLKCGQVMGRRIGNQWTSSEWVVEGLTPEPDVRQWFMKYVNDIRVAPLRPYLLYNSWYDMEAPQMVKDPNRVMNEKNVLRTIKIFHKRLTEERGLKLNAFVLDDGWDKYKSAWQVSKKQFPHGFKPIINALAKTNTKLGIWFGPIGGYSHRDWRVDWMRAHGYETVGDEMCIAGTNYHKLFKSRVDNLVSQGVGYYKWDGIQFSCSEPNHGHHIGIYSRHDIMQSVIDLTHSVRSEDPNIFLNITSGTWLSPWWVKYANTIWMQGSDYGYTNIPSISQRDRAITYRDYTLYTDFKKDNFWFPIANLMTHGIIKGWLQQLGGAKEPLDKFTDNALLYLSRGVSMWELYISPDLLTNREWDVLAQDIKWAKANFNILQHTVMIGGNPVDGQTYGYAHFSGNRGIIAARNPGITEKDLDFTIAHKLGIDNNADSLVVERVYPNRWISPRLFATGSELHLPLKGYETAIYEIFPVKSAKVPLLAGAGFSVNTNSTGGYSISVQSPDAHEGGARLLNPGIVENASVDGTTVRPGQLNIPAENRRAPVSGIEMTTSSQGTNGTYIHISMNVDSSMQTATLAALLQSKTKSGKIPAPSVTILDNGVKDSVSVENQTGQWGWYKIPVKAGMNKITISVKPGKDGSQWTGSADVWLLGRQQVKVHSITMHLKSRNNPSGMLPLDITGDHTVQTQYRIGTTDLR